MVNLLVVQNFILMLITDTWKTERNACHFVNNRTTRLLTIDT